MDSTLTPTLAALLSPSQDTNIPAMLATLSDALDSCGSASARPIDPNAILTAIAKHLASSHRVTFYACTTLIKIQEDELFVFAETSAAALTALMSLIRREGGTNHISALLVSILHEYARTEALRTLVQETPVALSLIMSLWQLEPLWAAPVRDVLGSSLPRLPTAADLLPLYVYPLASGTRDSLLSARFVPNTALTLLRQTGDAIHGQHAADGLVALLRNAQSHLSTLAFLHTIPPHRDIFLAERSPIFVVRLLVQIASQPLEVLIPHAADAILPLLGGICAFLNAHLLTGGVPQLVFALEQNLLPALLRIAPCFGGPDTSDSDSAALHHYRTFLCDLLPPYLIYASVLREVLRFLPREAMAAFAHAPAKSRCEAAWAAFYVEKPTCNSVKCDDLAAHTNRCSGCMVVSYCSEVCQRLAWHEHKADCRRDSSDATASSSPPPQPSQQDIDSALHLAHRQIADYLVAHTESDNGPRPGQSRILLALDYSCVPAKITLHPDADADIPELESESAPVPKRAGELVGACKLAVYVVFPFGGEPARTREGVLRWDAAGVGYGDTAAAAVDLKKVVEVVMTMAPAFLLC
ncbi:MYND-type domain-containing protein [Mycena kentingensis (nom. inval.)]|nr:MYND-type domain-containing protein [Mycena kentingensis (nom. inval.)]